jgi:hypothetical protein
LTDVWLGSMSCRPTASTRKDWPPCAGVRNQTQESAASYTPAEENITVGAGSSAIITTAITASLLVVFLWLGPVRARWKALALAAFGAGACLVAVAAPPIVFVAGLIVQTFLAISLCIYFKAGL